jgi:hypothetical protein
VYCRSTGGIEADSDTDDLLVDGEEDTVLGLELRWYVALKVIDDRAGRFRA